MKTIVARQGITKRELAALICKIIAIWYVFKLLLESLEILRFMADSLFTLLTTVFTFTLYLGLLYLMWYKSELIAKWLIVNDGPLSLTGRFMANQIMPIALGLIGVMYVIYGLSGVCWTASTLLMQTGNDYWVSSLIHATFNLLIGWVLLFGAARISKVVLWLRLAGTGLNK